MRIETIIFFSLVVGLILVTMGSVVIDSGRKYDQFRTTPIDASAFDNYTIIDYEGNTADIISSSKGDIYGGESTEEGFITGASKAPGRLFDSLKVVAKVGSAVTQDLRLPPIFANYFYLWIGVMLIFGIMYVIFRIRAWT